LDDEEGPLLGEAVLAAEGRGLKLTPVKLAPRTGKHTLYFAIKGGKIDQRVATIFSVLFGESLPGVEEPAFAEMQQRLHTLLNVRYAK
ncbi:MAG: hypothetical protein AAFO94_21235, partial [Bacteroidota bacterium]